VAGEQPDRFLEPQCSDDIEPRFPEHIRSAGDSLSGDTNQ